MLFVRNLVFYVCFAVFGMDARGYFAVVLATHVLASLLVGVVARRLTGNGLVACLAGVLFAVTPANHGTLGWYSASGHALAAVAVLAALLVVVPAPGDESPLAPRMAVFAALAMLAASQSFGTGAAVALVFPIVAVLLRPATLRAPLSRAILAAVPVLVLGRLAAHDRSADTPQPRRHRVDPDDGSARRRLSPRRPGDRAPAGRRCRRAAPGVCRSGRPTTGGPCRWRRSRCPSSRWRRPWCSATAGRAGRCWRASSLSPPATWRSPRVEPRCTWRSSGTTSCRPWPRRPATSTWRRACWRWSWP